MNTSASTIALPGAEPRGFQGADVDFAKPVLHTLLKKSVGQSFLAAFSAGCLDRQSLGNAPR
jgi:hypothetical protein